MSHAQPIPIASSSKVTQDSAPTPRSLLASYGSPRTLLLGSYGQRFSLGVSPGMLGLGDASFKPVLGSSIENEHDALIKTLNGADMSLLSEDMCRNYSCCGLTLNDLHALVEHFEEAHVLVVDPMAGPEAFGGFDLADDMELDEQPAASGAAAPFGVSAFDNTSVLVRRSAGFATPTYAPYPTRRQRDYATDASECVPPELLFSPSATPSPSPSRDGSPEPPRRASSTGSSAAEAPKSADSAAVPSSETPVPGSRPKPFRCPKEGCNKSYKQANGLKYHLTHGQCNFAPIDPNSDDLKPYICQVGCNKRFKNMSGLRPYFDRNKRNWASGLTVAAGYHYQHTNEHGKAGLALLEAGKLPAPSS
ncbi:hypothetical protein AURDEDRAFT_111070 [Auricularia subglabra TFB-10046 SS5]|nr:hypothetical protein AURDEDRAFT_111070 [Auricularia subglabra TFB-10046 SS5]